MKRFSLIHMALVGASLLSARAHGQTIYEYRTLRASYHIDRPVSLSVLDTLVGAKVCELQGVVKGMFHTSEGASILLERSDGATVSVDGANVPDWLENNQIPVRLIVRAVRNVDGGALSATLLGAAPEGSVTDGQPATSSSTSSATGAQHAQSPSSKPGHIKTQSRNSRSGTVGAREWVVPSSRATPIYADFIRRQNRRLSRQEAERIAEGVVGFSLHYGIDPRLIMAVLFVESGFDPGSTSRSGAMGLGQLMPGTAEWMGVHDAYDSVESVYGCVKLIRTHIDQYRKETGRDSDAVVLALAAYNAGIGAVRRSGGVPPYRETQAYVRRVIDVYARMCGH